MKLELIRLNLGLKIKFNNNVFDGTNICVSCFKCQMPIESNTLISIYVLTCVCY